MTSVSAPLLLAVAAALASSRSSAMVEPMRWSDDKAARFQALREQEARAELSPADRVQLDALMADLDADEAEALAPASQRLRTEAEAIAKKTASLDVKARELLRIAEEHERLVADASSALERLRERSAALAEHYLRVMGHELRSDR